MNISLRYLAFYTSEHIGLPAATATYHDQKCAHSDAIVFKNRWTSGWLFKKKI